MKNTIKNIEARQANPAIKEEVFQIPELRPTELARPPERARLL